MDERSRHLPLDNPIRLLRHSKKLWMCEVRQAKAAGQNRVRCPCTQCGDTYTRRISIHTATRHLKQNGRHPRLMFWRDRESMDSSDDEWEEHGRMTQPQYPFQNVGDMADGTSKAELELETDHAVDEPEIERMVADIFQNLESGDDSDDGAPNIQQFVGIEEGSHIHEFVVEDPTPSKIRAAMGPLYPGANMTTLGFLLEFVNTCGNHNVLDVVVSELVTLFNHAAPEGNSCPRNYYEAKCLSRHLGLGYDEIHACQNGCMLFRGPEDSELTICRVCQSPRYQDMENKIEPMKVLRHFPIIPRLLRMYKTKSIAEMLTWAANNKSSDGLQRHPGDNRQWKEFDDRYPEFAGEPRNIRFGLSLDGVNPFGQKNNSHPCWPVTLLNYNLLLWLATKKFFVMLALLIPGSESVKDKNIDVFLAPLLDELAALWAGVAAIDVVNREGHQKAFLLRAMVIWTINDYPTYGTISGLSVKGYVGCAVCGPYLACRDYSKPCKNICYQRHRRWLPIDHEYRGQRYKKAFNNMEETDPPPSKTSVAEILRWARLKDAYDRDGGTQGTKHDPAKIFGVKRKSCLFDLPYWKNC